MNNAPVVAGTRRAYKELVDGTLRVQVDIDPQFKEQFLRLFPQIDMPLALAPLVPDFGKNSHDPDHERRVESWQNLGPITQSAILVSKEEAFQQFVAEKVDVVKAGEEHAAQYIRDRCKVSSRKELDTADGARTRFGALMAEYREWAKK